MLPELLGPAFLRHARAIPLAADANTLVLAAADPLDPFTPSAVAAATGRRVQLQLALPIELDAAMNRLYPDDQVDPAAGDAHKDAPLEATSIS